MKNKIKNERKRIRKLFDEEWAERVNTHEYTLTSGMLFRMMLWSIFCPKTYTYFMYKVINGEATNQAYFKSKASSIENIKTFLDYWRGTDLLEQLEERYNSKLKKK